MKLKNIELDVVYIVLIECNNLMRVDWPLALVVEVMHDKEGIVQLVR